MIWEVAEVLYPSADVGLAAAEAAWQGCAKWVAVVHVCAAGAEMIAGLDPPFDACDELAWQSCVQLRRLLLMMPSEQHEHLQEAWL